MLGHDRRVRTLTSGAFGDRAHVRARRSKRRWVLDGLEDRVLLSGSPPIYTTNSTGDGTSNTGDSGTLHHVIRNSRKDPMKRARRASESTMSDPPIVSPPRDQTSSTHGRRRVLKSGWHAPDFVDIPGNRAGIAVPSTGTVD
jgi:hypothetical protein